MASTKHSVVFGFTTNLEPNKNRRLRLDDLESTERNNDLPFSEFFSERIAAKVPARDGYSRGHDAWEKGRKLAGLGRGTRQFAFVSTFNPLIDSDGPNPLSFVLQGGGAAASGPGAGSLSTGGVGLTPPSGGGAAGITGGSPSGVSGTPGGVGGGFAAPSIGTPGGIGGGIGGGGGFTGGGSTTGSNGNNGQNQTPSIFNTNTNTLSNKQQQQQQQQQHQSQHQNQNQHQHQNQHGHVVPAPASLLLGLLGLPGLYFLRRRKAAATTEAAA